MADQQTTRRRGRLKDLSDQTFGYWTVIALASTTGHGTRWTCRCRCGTISDIGSDNLTRGRSTNCGCARRTKNGKSTMRECRIYMHMLDRCYKPTADNYPSYGGKGVYICQRWRESFENFLADMGVAPSLGHSIDRIDANGSYTCGHCDECREKNQPANCRWATKIQQGRNNRRNLSVTHEGKTLLLKEWAELHNVGYHALYSRLLRGWSFADAISAPPGARKPR